MKNILKRLYSGDLFPYEEIKPDSEEYKLACHRLYQDFPKFRASLSTEQQEVLQKLTGDMYFLADADCYAHFAYGFRLGTALLCETLYHS
ncbi:MAG: hypothetical protein IKI92_02905 [Anaerotignum sp.]|nr:hypothetical protein [Anaerotignum sp.]